MACRRAPARQCQRRPRKADGRRGQCSVQQVATVGSSSWGSSRVGGVIEGAVFSRPGVTCFRLWRVAEPSNTVTVRCNTCSTDTDRMCAGPLVALQVFGACLHASGRKQARRLPATSTPDNGTPCADGRRRACQLWRALWRPPPPAGLSDSAAGVLHVGPSWQPAADLQPNGLQLAPLHFYCNHPACHGLERDRSVAWGADAPTPAA